MRRWLALGVAFLVFGIVQIPAAQVRVGTQQMRPGMPARDAEAVPTGAAMIRGRVVSGETGAPIRRAQVRLSSPEVRGGRVAQTDAEGRFEFRDLPAGRYSLSASKAGYVNLQYGQRRPFEQGRPIELLDAQVVDKADFALPRGSAITGRVLDEFGEPVAEAMVQAMRYQFVGGQRRLTPTGRGGQTNDLGQYRIFGLPPGEYYVSATVRSGGNFIALEGPGFAFGGEEESTAYAPTYYPGTANPTEASRLSVAIGQETGSVDFAMLPVRTARITGLALDSTGQPAAGAMVMLIPRSLEGAFMRIGGSGGRVTKDGTFTLSNVAPGDYTLQIRTGGAMTMIAGDGTANFVMATTEMRTQEGPAAQREPEFAQVPITVAGQDITGLTVNTGPGGRMTGTVVFEDGAPPARGRWQNLRVLARPVDAELMTTVGRGLQPVAEDGSFEVTGIAGHVLVRPIALPQGWTLKAVEHNGLDVTDSPLEFRGAEEAAGVRVVLTALSTEITGGVTDDRAQPVKDYTAVVFAEDRTKWGPHTRFVAVGRPDQDGRFRVTDLPPADYLAVALDYVQNGEWYDPDFLERLRSKATAFRLGAGEKKAVDLKISEY